jgi:hypothetical protein
MDARVSVRVTLQPPAVGEPCNGCGQCCREEVCGLGVDVFGKDQAAPCPAIVERDGRTWCGVIEAADRADVAFGAHMRFRLGIGRGCDAEF